MNTLGFAASLCRQRRPADATRDARGCRDRDRGTWRHV